MTTSPLKFILNFQEFQTTHLNISGKLSNNRMNSMGEHFEVYIKNLFCGYIENPEKEIVKNYKDFFSWNGAKNSPPDLIIKNSDAIEIKKIEGVKPDISLNSSNPKNKLYSSSTLITDECKNCEQEPWVEKDILYVIGSVNKDTEELYKLWLVYGDCYCAKNSTYENIKKIIKSGVETLPDLVFSESNELGRLNKIDPLGITNLRIRGMWTIQHPTNVFKYLEKIDEFEVNFLVLEEKYKTFDQGDIDKIEANKEVYFSNVEIKDPNNPVKFLNAKLIQLCLKK
jgi:hypothetical protein